MTFDSNHTREQGCMLACEESRGLRVVSPVLHTQRCSGESMFLHTRHPAVISSQVTHNKCHHRCSHQSLSLPFEREPTRTCTCSRFLLHFALARGCFCTCSRLLSHMSKNHTSTRWHVYIHKYATSPLF